MTFTVENWRLTSWTRTSLDQLLLAVRIHVIIHQTLLGGGTRPDVWYTQWDTRALVFPSLEYTPYAMLRAILNKSWRQHPTRYQLYGHLPPITKTIQVRLTRHTEHCWRSKDELISDVLLWIPTYDQAKAGRPARTYIQQLCEDTGCNPEDLPEAMDDRGKWRERVRDIRAGGMTWWWWWYKEDNFNYWYKK